MIREPNAEHQALLGGFKACLGREGKDLPAEELLAIAAQFVGMLVAVQDRRRYTPDAAMAIVSRNIEIGNGSAVDSLLGPGNR